MALSVSEITEVPLWLSNPGDNTDSWFFQQLQRFASGRNSGLSSVESGILDYSGTGSSIVPIVTQYEPKAIMTFCPDNIALSSPFVRIGSESIFIILQAPSTVVVLAPGTGFADSVSQNGNGTWTFDPASSSYGIGNSTTDTDYYVLFCQR